jgi:pheromone shutdown-related protein TraB
MISSPIKRLNIAGKEILLIGTAHVSHQSAIEVDQLIRAEEFDCVAVELCPARLETMTDPERWKKTDIFTVIKEGKTMVLLSQLILSAYQKRIATKLGIEPGAEMRTAIKTASELNIPLSVIDRDIKVTLRRTWANMSFWAVTKLLFSSVFSYSDANSISEEEIEKLKGEDELSSAIKEFSKELPQVKESLIDERDIYMAAKILEAEGRKIAAVIGAGHLEGIYRHLTSEHPLNYDELEIIPAPSPISKILAYGIPAFIVGMFLYGFIYFDMELQLGSEQLWPLLIPFQYSRLF